nr:hypothetical protein [Comamonas testosteroni]
MHSLQKSVLFALSLVFASVSALATPPLFDQIEISAQKGRLHHNAQGWMSLPESETLRSMRIAERCSAMGGPRGKFSVADGSLWLTGVYRCGGDIPLSAVYPQSASHLLADWVTGDLTAELGKVICQSRDGFPIFERIASLSVQAGRVTQLSYQESGVEQCAREMP